MSGACPSSNQRKDSPPGASWPAPGGDGSGFLILTSNSLSCKLSPCVPRSWGPGYPSDVLCHVGN